VTSHKERSVFLATSYKLLLSWMNV